MHTGKAQQVQILYGIRHKLDPWMMTPDKSARDFLWENINRYSHIAGEWEICERIVITAVPVSIELVEPVAEKTDISLEDPITDKVAA